MPYSIRADLPDSVKDNLPAHAQDIDKEAFISAWEQYKLSAKDESRAHAVAWSAVKQRYHKNEEGDWVKGASDDYISSVWFWPLSAISFTM